MKTVKHLCFTSHSEVMARDSNDVGTMVNLLALNSWKHKIQILADCEMSTHVHLIVVGDDVSAFVKDLRRQYTCHFAAKYGRRTHDRFGEKGFFQLDVYGNAHIQAALSYVLRNPLHHGVTGTPFEYRFSSINDIFPAEMGKFDRVIHAKSKDYKLEIGRNGNWKKRERFLPVTKNDRIIESKLKMKTFLPRRSEWPDEWKMSTDGVFLRSCFEELRLTEMQFVSPGSFQFNMFRKSDEKWLQEQSLDNNGLPPVDLSGIEPFADNQTIASYLANERASTFRITKLNDFDVCKLIDRDVVPACKCHSVYELDDTRRSEIASMLVRELSIPERQALRCLGIPTK